MAKVTDPIDFGPLKLRNRLVGAPLLIIGGADPNKRIMTQAVIDLYRERAAGGIEMITSKRFRRGLTRIEPSPEKSRAWGSWISLETSSSCGPHA